MTAAIALSIVALGVATLALIGVRHLFVRLCMIEGEEDEEEAEEEPQELWLSDGELYSADKAALEAACPDAVAFCTYEGVPCAVVPGQGVVSLHKLLSENKVRAVK